MSIVIYHSYVVPERVTAGGFGPHAPLPRNSKYSPDDQHRMQTEGLVKVSTVDGESVDQGKGTEAPDPESRLQPGQRMRPVPRGVYPIGDPRNRPLSE